MESVRKLWMSPSILWDEIQLGVTSPIPDQSESNSIAQSSSTSSPHPQPEARPLLVNQHASSFNGEVEVDVEHNRNSPPSTADDGQLAPTTDHFSSTGSESRTIDVAEASDDELNDSMFFDAPEELLSEGTARRASLLHASALSGKWEYVKRLIVDKSHDCVRAEITRNKDTILHIAAKAKQTAFVEKLLDRMTSDDMTLPNKYGYTALCFAAASGVVRIAKLMVDKNKDLPLIRTFDQLTPLFIAISYKRRKMASYLLSVTDFKQLTRDEQIHLFIATIHSDLYDISLQVLEVDPHLAFMRCTKNGEETALHVMARKPSAIGSTMHLNRWKKHINSYINGIYNIDVMKASARELVELLYASVLYHSTHKEMLELIRRPTRLPHEAAKAGNVEFLIVLIRSYPDIVWEEDDDGKNIFHVAIENRLENVFNLIDEIGGLNEFPIKNRLTNDKKYNMLHLAAKIAAPNHLNRVSGAALQMQRELLWFKEMEKIVLPSQLEAKCDGGLTPRQLFTNQHEGLRKDGEKWMKSTANSCMLVATLITTVVFAATFTVPGGNDNNTGNPIFQRKLWFTVFAISDAIALISSSTSILIFLSILTSRYAEKDFLHSLPSKLLFGLASLFISIVCMVVAFSATFFILYHEANIRVPTMVTAMTMVPVICFCVFEFKLWVDILHNTYLSRFLFKPHQRKLFSTSLVIELYNELEEEENEGEENRKQ